jgi:HSP20 family protein
MIFLIKQMALTPFSSIFDDFARFNKYDDVFFGPMIFPRSKFLSKNNSSMTLDMKENDKEYLIKVDLPGVEKDKIDISIDNNLLTISSERSNVHDDSNDNFHFSERFYGKISRSVTIPKNVDIENISASYIDGVLNINLLKINKQTTKSVKIQ